MSARDDDEPQFLTHAPGSLSPAEERERRRRSEAIERDRRKREKKKKRRPKSEKPRKRKPTTAIFSRTAFGKRRAAAAKGAGRAPRAPARRAPTPAPPPAPDLNETWRGFRRPRPSAPVRPQGSTPAAKTPITVRFKSGVAGGGRRFGAGLSRMGQTAGWGALDRTLHAARVARRREVQGPRPAPLQERPWLIPGLVGGLLRPLSLSGLLSVGLASALLASGVLLLWFLPPLGVVATALALAVFATLRLKAVVDVGHGRDDIGWPEWEESLAGASVSAGVLLLFLPALLFAWQASGGPPWRGTAGLPARVQEVVLPPADNAVARAAAVAGQAYKDQAWRSHDLVREHRRAVGVEGPDPGEQRRRAQAQRQVESIRKMAGQKMAGDRPPPRAPVDASPLAAARRTGAAVVAELKRLLDPRGHAGAALAARVCLWAALFLFPMALLAAATLKSAYAALYIPLLLGSILRAPLAYLLTVGAVLLVDLGLVFALTLPLPVAQSVVGDLGSARVLALGVTTFLVLVLALSSACVVGRFYRCRTGALGW